MSIHVEIFGLPGCGKSTVAHILAKKLIDCGYQVKEPSSSINSIIGIRKQIIKGFNTVCFAIMHPKKLVAIYKYISDNRYKGVELIKQIINISIKVREYLAYEPRTIIIWDEGIAQATLSLVVNNYSVLSNLYEKKIMDLCNNNTKQVHVYIKEELDVIAERLKMRGTFFSRVEKIKEEERIKMLKCFGVAADCLTNDILVIGNNQSPQIIASQILDSLLSTYLLQDNW